MNQEIGVQEQYVYETASPWRNRGQSHGRSAGAPARLKTAGAQHFARKIPKSLTSHTRAYAYFLNILFDLSKTGKRERADNKEAKLPPFELHTRALSTTAAARVACPAPRLSLSACHHRQAISQNHP